LSSITISFVEDQLEQDIKAGDHGFED